MNLLPFSLVCSQLSLLGIQTSNCQDITWMLPHLPDELLLKELKQCYGDTIKQESNLDITITLFELIKKQLMQDLNLWPWSCFKKALPPELCSQAGVKPWALVSTIPLFELLKEQLLQDFDFEIVSLMIYHLCYATSSRCRTLNTGITITLFVLLWTFDHTLPPELSSWARVKP